MRYEITATDLEGKEHTKVQTGTSNSDVQTIAANLLKLGIVKRVSPTEMTLTPASQIKLIKVRQLSAKEEEKLQREEVAKREEVKAQKVKKAKEAQEASMKARLAVRSAEIKADAAAREEVEADKAEQAAPVSKTGAVKGARSTGNLGGR